MTQLTISAAVSPAVMAAATGRRRALLQASGGFLEVAVAGLPHLIQFSLPLPTNLANATGLKAQCSYYDNTAGAYSTDGCVGLPNPSPPGLPMAFKPTGAYLSNEDSRTEQGSGPPGGPTLSP